MKEISRDLKEILRKYEGNTKEHCGNTTEVLMVYEGNTKDALKKW